MFLSAYSKDGPDKEKGEKKEEGKGIREEGIKIDKSAPRSGINVTAVKRSREEADQSIVPSAGGKRKEYSEADSLEIRFVQFGLQSPDEIRASGVVSITNHRLYEKHQPAKNGLFDLRMGPPNREFNCETCKMNFKDCPGHPGYIELAVPVYHPLEMSTVCKVLTI